MSIWLSIRLLGETYILRVDIVVILCQGDHIMKIQLIAQNYKKTINIIKLRSRFKLR